ncbi:hypothetical protein EGI22_10055 [Lacihabitans sp. LS3-19]|nr:hypothetical protein [Lacihabitans sp. LS3-19]
MSFRGLLHSIAVTVTAFVLFYILQPFGIKEMAEGDKIMVMAISGMIVLAVMLICQFVLPFVLKSFYDEHHWTGTKQLIQFLLMSVLIIFGLMYFLKSKNVGDSNLPIDALIYFGFSVIPLALFVYIQESMHDAKFKRKAEGLNQDLKTKGVVNSENPLKILVFQGNSEKLSLIPNQLIYVKLGAEAAEFYYQNPFGIDKAAMTIDTKLVLDELKDHPQFVKFSQDIMLNSNAIQKVSGTARGYDIAIAKVNEMVKVSGKFRKNLEKL